ncbi:THUMP domain-containing protein 1 homolog [Orussus abietinus]|uniref:THUMP domain-containing protein 1 homolog n=1 Tax=Orussus abietinus TaxID=222816 RepID=UPI0006257EA7|nr:THUMP domain-containing protein 1 homolog [Orussus abietinus]
MDVKRKKNYFSNYGNQKRRKQFVLESGMTGFLCTCNFREKDCVRDAYKILDKYSIQLYGPEGIKTSGELKDEKKGNGDPPEGEKDGAEEDILIAINKELDELKAVSKKDVSQKRFQVVDTGAKNVIFIRSSLPNPLEVVSTIIKELDETKKQHTRFLLRILPIEVVCKANMNDINAKADVLFQKYFSQEPKTFCIVFNRHSNNSMNRNDVIEDLAKLVVKKNPDNKADLKNPEIAIVVEVIRGFCLLAIAPDYYKYKKYNLLEICNPKEKEQKENSQDKPPELEKQVDKSVDEKNTSDKVEQEEKDESETTEAEKSEDTEDK